MNFSRLTGSLHSFGSKSATPGQTLLNVTTDTPADQVYRKKVWIKSIRSRFIQKETLCGCVVICRDAAQIWVVFCRTVKCQYFYIAVCITHTQGLLPNSVNNVMSVIIGLCRRGQISMLCLKKNN